MKRIIITCLLSAPALSFAQKLYLKNSGAPIDQKVNSALRYDYQVTSADSSDFIVEVFFTGKYSLGKGYRGYYKLYDKSGREVYRSDEWKAGGYGGVAEDYIVKKIVKKDLPVALKKVGHK